MEPAKPTPRQTLAAVLLMSLGSALVAVGVYFFKFPNHFSMGGVSGLSILLGQLIPSHVEKVCPLSRPLTDQKMLELFFAVLLPALGAAILFNIGASTGGTDIMAMILKKYTGLDVGRALLLSDVTIAAAALVVFDVETGLFSLLGLALKSVLVDTAIESLNRRKSFTVVTHTPEPVCHFINEELHRGATVWKGQGAYTGQEQYIILTALSQQQAVLLRNYLKRTDPHAFMLITNSSEIFGKGFLRA